MSRLLFLIIIQQSCCRGGVCEKVFKHPAEFVKQDLETRLNDKSFYQYAPPFAPVHPAAAHINQDILHQPEHKIYGQLNGFVAHKSYRKVDFGPLLLAFLLNTSLLDGISQGSTAYNHPEHLPVNPYVALLLSHYGRYVPLYGTGAGIYGYAASNNYHNNKPFGSYKIHEDGDT